jgi:hypothetical protein
MPSRKKVLLLLFLTVCGSFGQTVKPEPFLVRPNLPFVYLTVDHAGVGKLYEGHRRQRVWLQFHNNCREAIDLHASGAPADAPEDKLTVMYELVVPIERGVIVTLNDESPKRKTVKPPPDTMAEVGSSVTIGPGEALSFSVPTAHFSADWEMHIPLWFHLPPVKGPRDEDAGGGEPQMFLSYAVWDLPPSVRKQVMGHR